eukprot:contig_27731_g6827
MYLDGRSLMHIVDKDTLYSAATFCHGEAIEDLWKQYLTTWVHPQAMATACKEMTAQMARARVRSALAARVPAAADRDVQPGTQVLVYREPPVDQWEGPFTAVVTKYKMVWLAIDGQLKPFGVDKVKPQVATRVDDAVPAQLPVNDDDAGARTAAGTAIEAGDGHATAADRSDAPRRGQEHQANAQAPVPAMDVGTSPREGAENPDYGQMLDAVISGERFLST